MKIGLLTYFIGQNYGASLQAYATLVALRRLGHEPVFINYHQPWSKGPSFLSPMAYVGRSVKGTIYKFRWMFKHLKLRRKFSHFERMLPKTPRYYGSNLKSLKQFPPDCEIYLVGSDQVWNCSGGYDAVAAYFLPFGNKSVSKISYASSLGGYEFPPECKNQIRRHLSSFRAIGVREISSAAYLQRSGISNVICVPDPTLLLTPEDYDHLIKSCQPIKTDGLVYMLNEQGEDLANQVRRCLGNCTSVMNIALQGFELPGAKNVVVSVPEFLCAISNASVVVTNSFHCVIFSVLFHKPFHVIPLGGKFKKTNARLVDFLDEIGLNHRILDGCVASHSPQMDSIDWAVVDARLSVLRQRGWDFLKSALVQPQGGSAA